MSGRKKEESGRKLARSGESGLLCAEVWRWTNEKRDCSYGACAHSPLRATQAMSSLSSHTECKFAVQVLIEHIPFIQNHSRASNKC